MIKMIQELRIGDVIKIRADTWKITNLTAVPYGYIQVNAVEIPSGIGHVTRWCPDDTVDFVGSTAPAIGETVSLIHAAQIALRLASRADLTSQDAVDAIDDLAADPEVKKILDLIQKAR